ncbi:MAG: histidine phosphatase family protein [Solirubrobacterales bacterium]
MRVILVRHGLTELNEAGRYQGSRDIPLSDQGRWQAAQVAGRLAAEKIDAVYASDLSRAYDTAVIVAEQHRLPVQKVPAFREINFGHWEGLTGGEIVAEFGQEIYDLWLYRPAESVIEAGDNLHDFAERVSQGWRSILAGHGEDDTVVIVAHGGVFMVLGCLLMGRSLNDIRKYYQHNAAISILTVEHGKAGFELLNCCAHLEENQES